MNESEANALSSDTWAEPRTPWLRTFLFLVKIDM